MAKKEPKSTDRVDNQGYTVHHFVVFALTFASYAQIYALRKTLSYIKSTLVETWTPADSRILYLSENETLTGDYHIFSNKKEAEPTLGALDSAFTFSYAVGLYFLGPLSERIEPRVVLFLGMFGSSIVTMAFGFLTERLRFYSIPFYVCLWVANGLCQSASWPTVVKLMDNWFGNRKRGLVFGIWSSAAAVGGIAGAHTCSAILKFGYEFAFLVNGSLLLAISIVIFFGTVSSPSDLVGAPNEKVKSEDVDNASGCSGDSESRIDFATKPRAINFFTALLLPGVIAYALSYTCLKSVTYSIFFWLPYYMEANFHWDASTSAQLSTYFDWGGIAGSIVCGFASDLLGKRSPVLVFMLTCSIFSLAGYATAPVEKVVNAILMTIVGFFVFGATNMVSSAVTVDLGRQPAVRDNKEALSTVSGIIEGSGTAGAALCQSILPFIAAALGWNSMFYMLMILLFISAVLLAKLCYRESNELVQSAKRTIQELQKQALALAGGVGKRRSIFPNIYVIEIPKEFCDDSTSVAKI